MPKHLDFKLGEEELEVIAQAIKHDKRLEVRQRAIGLRMLHEGQSPKAIAATMSVSQPTVYDWHHRWQAGGLEGLANRPKSGRPRKATVAYVELLEQVTEQDPQELGYAFTIWTADRLRLHMQSETGILLSQTQFRLLLKENDFVYRRPKHDLTDLQDPQAREAAEEWLQELKKAPKQARSTFSLWTKAP
jgi:putative transposase